LCGRPHKLLNPFGVSETDAAEVWSYGLRLTFSCAERRQSLTSRPDGVRSEGEAQNDTYQIYPKDHAFDGYSDCAVHDHHAGQTQWYAHERFLLNTCSFPSGRVASRNWALQGRSMGLG